MTQFGSCIGRETLCREYKGFSLIGLDIDTINPELLCQNLNFIFNEDVLKSLKYYILKYLPKYTCAFLNNNNIDNGRFYIGVNDYGFVKGIPFKGNLPIRKIKDKIFKVVCQYVKNNTGTEFDFTKLINIDIVKIKNPDVPTEPIPKIFTEYIKQKKSFIEKYDIFIDKYQNWKIRYKFFTQKLINLVNNKDSRIMLIEYINKYNPSSSVIKLLKSDYILDYKCHDQVNELKLDIDNPYYWVCKWKDEMIKIIKKSKPIFREHNFSNIIPYNLIVSMENLIPYWIHNNPSMNLYLIKIRFNSLWSVYGMKTSSELFFSYINKGNTLIRCKRCVLPNGEPACIPY